jgi:hypothetical protein
MTHSSLQTATVHFSASSPKCTGSATVSSRNVSAGTSRSPGTWRSTNSMPAGRRTYCRRMTTAAFKGACGFCRQPAHHAPRHLPCAPGRTACAGVRYDLGEQPVRCRFAFARREDRAQHRESDVRAVRRHDRIRLDASAHGHRHRDGCADGANPLPGAVAIAASGLSAGDRQNACSCGLSRSVPGTARVRPRSWRSCG